VVKCYIRTQGVALPVPEPPKTEDNDEEPEVAAGSELESSLPLTATSDKKEIV